MRGLAGLLTVVLVAVTGCGDGGDESSLPEHSPSATSESKSAEASESPAIEGLPEKPERPDDVNSDAGAKAFGKYVLEVFFYTFHTADSSLMRELAPEERPGCSFCDNTLNEAKKKRRKGVVNVPSEPTRYRKGRGVAAKNDSYATWEVNFPKAKQIVVKTGEEGTPTQEPKGWGFWFVSFRWEDSQWQLTEMSVEYE